LQCSFFEIYPKSALPFSLQVLLNEQSAPSQSSLQATSVTLDSSSLSDEVESLEGEQRSETGITKSEDLEEEEEEEETSEEEKVY